MREANQVMPARMPPFLLQYSPERLRPYSLVGLRPYSLVEKGCDSIQEIGRESFHWDAIISPPMKTLFLNMEKTTKFRTNVGKSTVLVVN